MDYGNKEGQYITSNPVREFLCPYCSTDFDEKLLFIDHLKEQHPKQPKDLDMKVFDKLEDYKSGKSNILNF